MIARWATINNGHRKELRCNDCRSLARSSNAICPELCSLLVLYSYELTRLSSLIVDRFIPPTVFIHISALRVFAWMINYRPLNAFISEREREREGFNLCTLSPACEFVFLLQLAPPSTGLVSRGCLSPSSGAKQVRNDTLGSETLATVHMFTSRISKPTDPV